jgi:hypothetical protein
MDVLQDNEIPFAFDQTGDILSSIRIPSGSPTMSNHHNQSLQRILINGVPDSLLQGMLNPIAVSRRKELNSEFKYLVNVELEICGQNLGNCAFLTQDQSLLTPAVEIQNLDEVVSYDQRKGTVARKSFNSASYLVFKVDENHFPRMYSISLDSCLGLKVDSHWVCIGRDTNLT